MKRLKILDRLNIACSQICKNNNIARDSFGAHKINVKNEMDEKETFHASKNNNGMIIWIEII